MGLFKRRKKVEMSDYNHKKHRRKDSLLTSFDKLEYAIVSDNAEDEMLKICDTILGGRAVLANFDKIDARSANEMLAFISGVVYAKEGKVKKLDSRLFLFGRKEEFEDGSLDQYVEDTK